MDVERTIEFILQQHARTEAMMQRLEEKGDYDVGKARIIVEKSRRAGTMRK